MNSLLSVFTGKQLSPYHDSPNLSTILGQYKKAWPWLLICVLGCGVNTPRRMFGLCVGLNGLLGGVWN